MAVYLVGQISNIKDMDRWLEYKSKVGKTLEPYDAKLLFRGQKVDSFIRASNYDEIVVIEFESLEIAKKWYESKEYQDITAIREKGADVTIEMYG